MSDPEDSPRDPGRRILLRESDPNVSKDVLYVGRDDTCHDHRVDRRPEGTCRHHLLVRGIPS